MNFFSWKMDKENIEPSSNEPPFQSRNSSNRFHSIIYPPSMTPMSQQTFPPHTLHPHYANGGHVPQPLPPRPIHQPNHPFPGVFHCADPFSYYVTNAPAREQINAGQMTFKPVHAPVSIHEASSGYYSSDLVAQISATQLGASIKSEISPSELHSNRSSLSPNENLQWLGSNTNSTESDSRPCSRASGGVTKRTSKQLVEKQRRERINSSVNELKSLLLQDKPNKSLAQARLEKADVLELAVTRIRELEKINTPKTASKSSCSSKSEQSEQQLKSSVTRYAAGFAQCTQEVLSFLNVSDLDPSVKMKLCNHLQTCNRTLESATKKDNEPDIMGNFGINQNRHNYSQPPSEIKRSPFAPMGQMYNQASPLFQQRNSGSQLKTPPRVQMSPATPVSVKTNINYPTTPQQFLRPQSHLFRQPQFSKPESPYNGSPVSASSASSSSFKDSCPVLLGTVATPPTPKQSTTTSVKRLGTTTSSGQPTFAICSTPSPPTRKGNKPKRVLVRSSLVDSPSFGGEESNEEEDDEEVAGFEPMFVPTGVNSEDIDNDATKNVDGNCWRPW